MTARWIAVDYPSKKRLSQSDAMTVLDIGANWAWFLPWAVLGEVRTDRPSRMPYGVAHWYYDATGNPRQTVRTFQREEDARGVLEYLYRTHQEGCRCVAVFYWTPMTVNYSPEAAE